MDILAPLFANSGLTGAVLAGLLAIILVLLRDRRLEHGEWLTILKQNTDVLIKLSSLISEFKGMSKN
jgi:hypothetical protein